MGTRREGRECAVQFLYQCDLHPPANREKALQEFWISQKPTKPVQTFAEGLLTGTTEKLSEIDAKIASLAEHWDLNRIAAVDRNILRLAIYEMLYREEIPPVVSMNEAIDLAKRFGGDDSGRFVNGLLDRLKKDLPRPARHSAGDNGKKP